MTYKALITKIKYKTIPFYLRELQNDEREKLYITIYKLYLNYSGKLKKIKKNNFLLNLLNTKTFHTFKAIPSETISINTLVICSPEIF